MGTKKFIKLASSRLIFSALAIVFVGSLSTQVLPSVANAAQITTRSITMSTSAASTAATYALTFTPATTQASGELIVDFCSNSPLVSDVCNFTAGTVPTIASPTSSVGTATAVGTGSPVHTIKVTGLTLTAATPITINFTAGITNPTTNVSFYARVLTYSTGNAANYVPAATTGNTPTVGAGNLDTGGIALSTAANISITSKVFETLSFCVFTTSCGTSPVLTLGDPTTGALSVTNSYTNNSAGYSIATNAGSGASVVMKGTTLCRSSGANCLTGASQYTISATGSTATARSAGTEQFGMCVDVTGTASITPAATYTDSSAAACHLLGTGVYATSPGATFGFNDSAAAGGTNNSAGSQVFSSTGAVPSYSNTTGLTFLGNIAATTEAGIYTTSLNLVATGTF
ncbi:MAG: hypothetical protein NVS1B10_00720 [Candidatus Saccharimonadales bacterium]